MNIRKTLLFLGAAAIAAPLLKLLWDWAQTPGGAQDANGTSPRVKRMVEETLHEHEGEQTPFLQAFEAALAQEAQH
jgi:hypothetical protein